VNNARDIIKNGTATLEQDIGPERTYSGPHEAGVRLATAFGIAEKVRKGKPPSDDDIEAMRSHSVPTGT
jgi:DNA polymerase III alpha subunit (gram-positive type)